MSSSKHQPTRRMTLSLLCGGALNAFGGKQDFLLRSSANLVVLDVAVAGADGIPLAGLTVDQFQIVENGRRQTIKQFSAEEAPVSIGLVIDMSGSMHSKLAGVRQATSTFLEASNPKDEYFLIGFNDRAWVGLPARMEFSSKRDDIRKALLGVRSAGKTALYDGVALALKHVTGSRYERRVLVLITDGKDTASALSWPEALNLVRSSPVTIYTIGLFGEDEDSNRGVLKQLGKITGGRFYEPATPQAIESVCNTIARDIRARYTIAYTPPADARSTIRKIRVELLKAPGSPRATVRARSEYTLETLTDK